MITEQRLDWKYITIINIFVAKPKWHDLYEIYFHINHAQLNPQKFLIDTGRWERAKYSALQQ